MKPFPSPLPCLRSALLAVLGTRGRGVKSASTRRVARRAGPPRHVCTSGLPNDPRHARKLHGHGRLAGFPRARDPLDPASFPRRSPVPSEPPTASGEASPLPCSRRRGTEGGENTPVLGKPGCGAVVVPQCEWHQALPLAFCGVFSAYL